MSTLNIETLKKICNTLPDAYIVKAEKTDGTIVNLRIKYEVDIEKGIVTLKE